MSHDEMYELGRSYEEMLERGIALAGEPSQYFIDGRIAHLRSRLGDDAPIRTILDFGCGAGHAAVALAEAFGAEVTGVDVAIGAVEEARRRVRDERVRFVLADDLPDVRFDLCYVNGAYHHIAPGKRLETARRIHDRLRPGGILALFENNPWSIPARLVMRRIPFDHGSVMLGAASARRLLREAGFTTGAADYLFVFPRALRGLRRSEHGLRRLPVGAQYLVIARRS